MGKDLFIGYAHTNIFVRNLEEAIKFYETVFGFELLFIHGKKSDQVRLGMLKLNNCFLELSEPLTCKDAIIPAAQASRNHTGIFVSDINEAVKRIGAYGCEIDEPGIIFVENFGDTGVDLQVVFFRGPNGEFIELLQEMEN